MGIFIDLTKYVAISTLIILLLRHMLDGFPVYQSSIYLVASKDLTYVGCYDERLAVSIEYWIYAIMANAYGFNQNNLNKEKAEVVLQKIDHWLGNNIYDPEGIILDSTKKACKKIREEVEAYEEEMLKYGKAKLNFKVSPDYDYHEVSSNFKHNDYLDYQALINMLDNKEVMI